MIKRITYNKGEDEVGYLKTSLSVVRLFQVIEECAYTIKQIDKQYILDWVQVEDPLAEWITVEEVEI